MLPKYVTGADVNLGDVVRLALASEADAPYSSATVTAIDHERQEVTLYRPYVHTCGTFYTGGKGIDKVIAYIGTETFRVHYGTKLLLLQQTQEIR